ncbi:MAG: ATP-binding protein [Firmicutes bacterium]|nr:ATP-binding protein [Bacillota bacterium]
MATKSEIYKEILKQYDRLRTKKENELRKRRSEVYASLPRVEEIDREISMAGVGMAKNVLENPDNADFFQTELKTKLSALKNEKKEIMDSMGFDEDYLCLRHECDKCSDTGFIGGVRCSCFTQKLVDLAYNSSNMKDITKIQNFDSFDFSYYSDNATGNEDISPRQNIKRILEECLGFTRTFGKTAKNLLLYGSPGLGKTFVCSCVAKELLDRGVTVMYITAPQLFKALENEKFNRSDENEQEVGKYMEEILGVELLIVDDLGTEFSTVFSNSELFDIINTRLISKKPMIISTNLGLKNLGEKYSDRIISRIMGEFITLKFFGEDIRLIKKYRNS